MCEHARVKREQFLSALRRYCRKNRIEMRIDTVAGKGSHIKLYVRDRATILKDGELTPIYLSIVLKQLGLPRDVL